MAATMKPRFGHATPETMRETYLHAVPEEQRRAVESVERLVFGPKGTQILPPPPRRSRLQQRIENSGVSGRGAEI